MDARRPMMAMTTNSSISVNPRDDESLRSITASVYPTNENPQPRLGILYHTSAEVLYGQTTVVAAAAVPGLTFPVLSMQKYVPVLNLP